jgi:hypothetical protein
MSREWASHPETPPKRKLRQDSQLWRDTNGAHARRCASKQCSSRNDVTRHGCATSATRRGHAARREPSHLVANQRRAVGARLLCPLPKSGSSRSSVLCGTCATQQETAPCSETPCHACCPHGTVCDPTERSVKRSACKTRHRWCATTSSCSACMHIIMHGARDIFTHAACMALVQVHHPHTRAAAALLFCVPVASRREDCV